MSLVYSTDFGRACPGCGQPVAQCACKAKARPAGDGIVRVRRETAGRKGKGVTAIHGLPLDDAALVALAKQLGPTHHEIHVLPEEVQRAWRKGRSTRSTKTKAINDPEGLRRRIREEEELLALNGTLHPELTSINRNEQASA